MFGQCENWKLWPQRMSCRILPLNCGLDALGLAIGSMLTTNVWALIPSYATPFQTLQTQSHAVCLTNSVWPKDYSVTLLQIYVHLQSTASVCYSSILRLKSSHPPGLQLLTLLSSELYRCPGIWAQEAEEDSNTIFPKTKLLGTRSY